MALEEYERAIQGLIDGTLDERRSPEIPDWEKELIHLAERDDEDYLKQAVTSFDALYKRMFFGEDGHVRREAEQYLGASAQYIDVLSSKLNVGRDFVVRQIMIPRIMENIRGIVPHYLMPAMTVQVR